MYGLEFKQNKKITSIYTATAVESRAHTESRSTVEKVREIQTPASPVSSGDRASDRAAGAGRTMSGITPAPRAGSGHQSQQGG